ncbi:MAG: cation transporter [Bdellovibrionales bacterium]|nr:cation transporter [Bdellovibrionales bacterium]
MEFFFAIFELIGGFWTQSLAILSSALHDLGDSVALAIAYFLEVTSNKKSDRKYSYGYRRFSTLAALVTGVILCAGSLFILVESLPRIWSPASIPKAEGMIAFAMIGLVVNGIAAFRLSKGSSLNEKMLLWHLLEDVMSWALVLVGGLALMVWQWTWLDPLLAVLLSLWVIRNVFLNLRQVLQVILQAVPQAVNMEQITDSILKVDWVHNFHHMHVWSLDGETHILTAHLGLQEGLTLQQWDQVKVKIKNLLYQEGLAESTLEFEDSSQVCLEPHHEAGASKDSCSSRP